MNKPVVLFDADGFLLDFHTPGLAVAEKVIFQSTGMMVSLEAEDFETWDIFDVIGKQYERACYAEYEKPGFCASIQPYPDAVEGVREARKMADVIIVTSPLHSPTWCHERHQSLFQHFDIPKWDVIFASKKYLVKGCMLVDDRPSHVEDWARANDARNIAVIWDQPYNRSHRFSLDAWSTVPVMRRSSWFGPEGLLTLIEGLVRTYK